MLARLILLIMASFFFISSASGTLFPFSPGMEIIGSTQLYVTREDESLIELARMHSVGFNEIADANPGIDPFLPGPGVEVIVPSAWILPDVSTYDGLIINLSEMRLFYFMKDNKRGLRLLTYPIGIGSEGHETPTGSFVILEKKTNPSWRIPPGIRKERPELPAVMPPGPDNPLGTHAMRLSSGNILIHGTHRAFGVGRQVSHGCIRLYPEHIPVLFSHVPLNAQVSIVRQPIKVAGAGNRVFLEVHDDREAQINYFTETVRLLIRKGLMKLVDKEKMVSVLRKKQGIPIDVTIDDKGPEKDPSGPRLK
jgi:L,D-transpeptidase ErfK/SrfK